MEGLKIKRIDENRFEIPREGKMRVKGVVYLTEKMFAKLENDECLRQVANVATLPGILKHSLAMPDIHWGYGFPIGGVAAMDTDGGVISPGGVGYDINCGVRLLGTALAAADVKSMRRKLVEEQFATIPCGVGSRGSIPKLSVQEMKRVLRDGAKWAVEKGYGSAEDLDHIEERGCMREADPDAPTQRAFERGHDEMGTLGSGNHFLELGEVDEVYMPEVAEAFGLFAGQMTVLIHSGSRGFGYQVCDDSLKEMVAAMSKHKIDVPDRQLACAPASSEEGKRYFGAMAAAANFAFSNRQVMSCLAGKSLCRALGVGPADLGLRLVFDVCHNIAKLEEHVVDGRIVKAVVHRKGATRAFGPNHPSLPQDYARHGQPVLVPGDMGSCSFVCVGTDAARRETFGSSCHGAGRLMSRHQAIKQMKGRALNRELDDKGIYVLSRGRHTLAEEAPGAYKDVAEVVEVMHKAGISLKVARTRPFGVIKG